MESKLIRERWIAFFRDKKSHLHIPSASLVPQNPTLLLTNAGMVPFVPFFLGRETPLSRRMVSIQKCVRVGGKDSDLDNIGKTPRHLTFFEMLGNFSFGDYFKEEAIAWAWEMLTEVYHFKPEQLQVSIFAGDTKVAADLEAEKIWHKKIGLRQDKIIHLGRADNFWGPPGGISGPCGPCSEIYFCPPDGSEPIEIWNLVFMQYEQLEDGSLQTLSKPNVDTGAGLERIAAILQNKTTVFETDLLHPLIERLKAEPSLEEHTAFSLNSKIIADHLRCAAMLIADGIKPNNLGRGYILRMLIRRASRYGRQLGLKDPFLVNLLPALTDVFTTAYPEITEKQALIEKEIDREEGLFAETLEKGLIKFYDLRQRLQGHIISGQEAFDLYATYGFPIELTQDLAFESQLTVDLPGYERARENHATISNKGKFTVGFKVEDSRLKDLPTTEFVGFETISGKDSKVLFLEKISEEEWLLVLDRTPFYAESGGQVADQGYIYGQSDSKPIFKVCDVQKSGSVFVHKGRFETDGFFELNQLVSTQIDDLRRAELRKHHTSVHLLQAALRETLGNDVQQAGSLVQPDRARFDFSYPKALESSQIRQIERLINQWIGHNLPVNTDILDYEEAITRGALAFFGDKYDDRVRVLRVGADYSEAVSVELCGGTHVHQTGDIGGARIISETSVAAGTRRIEVIVGQSLLNLLNENTDRLESLASKLKVPISQVEDRVFDLGDQLRQTEKKLQDLERRLNHYEKEKLLAKIETIRYQDRPCALLVNDAESSNLRELLELMAASLQTQPFILFVYNAQKASYAVRIARDLSGLISAQSLLKAFAEEIGGSGGGRPDFAQGGGGDMRKVSLGIEKVYAVLRVLGFPI